MLWLTCIHAAAYAAGAGFHAALARAGAPRHAAKERDAHAPAGSSASSNIFTWLRVAGNVLLVAALEAWWRPAAAPWWRAWDGSALHVLAAAQQLGAHVVCADLWFYYTHRLLHTVPALYRGLHAVHHRETYPTALNALDAHPVEHLVSNVGSAVAGAALLAATGAPQFYAVFLGWVALATWSTCAAHSGLQPWCPLVGTSEYHDLHHRLHTCNYGQGTYFFDWMHGTFRRSVNS